MNFTFLEDTVKNIKLGTGFSKLPQGFACGIILSIVDNNKDNLDRNQTLYRTYAKTPARYDFRDLGSRHAVSC